MHARASRSPQNMQGTTPDPGLLGGFQQCAFKGGGICSTADWSEVYAKTGTVGEACSGSSAKASWDVN